jgi:alpha-L-fucosidase 2
MLRSYLAELDNGLHTEVVPRANGETLLREWIDVSQQDQGEWPHHRHVSHLIGLYPGTQINPTDCDSIYQAALRSLTWRGTAATGRAMG